MLEMRNATKAIVAAALSLAMAGCGLAACRSASPDLTTPSTTESIEPAPSPSQRPTQATGPPPEPRPTPYLPSASTEPVALPDGLDQFAWATVVEDGYNVEGSSTEAVLFAGYLGSAAVHVETLEKGRDWLWAAVDGDLVAVVRQSPDRTLIDVRRVDGWLSLAEVRLDGWALNVRLDAKRGVLYAGILRSEGGLDVARISFDGSRTNLLYLDKRFAETEPFPTERYTIATDDSGGLAIEACAHADGCRLWSVGATATNAGAPVTLPSATPFACYALAATTSWLLVYDDEVCFIDVSPAPVPLRAVSRVDGSTRQINNGEDEYFGSLVEAGGRTFAVGAHRSEDWSSSDIIKVDVLTGDRMALVPDLPNRQDTYTIVSRRDLPGAWVLLTPRVILDTTEPPDAMLLNVTSGEIIKLPTGTFGYNGWLGLD